MPAKNMSRPAPPDMTHVWEGRRRAARERKEQAAIAMLTARGYTVTPPAAETKP
jgi:hypothetical protein